MSYVLPLRPDPGLDRRRRQALVLADGWHVAWISGRESLAAAEAQQDGIRLKELIREALR